ncbi:hypothetical protein [Marivita hallyeonensis]|uniref:Uncharacterized protein n=1 Tax=Marivita hallyeonensis TaxID=996342 RepID=A0A1M5Y7I4_9RHOB|nr:hypothetical protein [Marivita hallyeonensis]SHI08045.1 hypothetical protein SAMN05443551_0143 [Marivita hallyeonensis]
MKRMMIATALVTTLGTAAMAATDEQIQQIERFAPGIETSNLTEAELQTAYGIVTSGDSRGEKIAKLRALETDANAGSFEMLSDAELMRLEQYAPGFDWTDVTPAQAQAALAITYGGDSEGVKSERVQAILTDENSMTEMNADITAGQRMMITNYAPNVDVDALSESDVQSILSVIHSGASRGEIAGQIEAIAGS